MALTALVVAIVSALLSAGTLLHNIRSDRRTGWNLQVISWWDRHDKQIHVEITNVGRLACAVSEIRYFITDLSPTQSPAEGRTFREWQSVIYDHEPLPEPIAPSAKIEVTKNIKGLPAVFTLEVWAWTGGRPYRSQKSTHRLNPGYSHRA